jgi:Concanavalin A-like lectin/glucanases superfamily
MKAKSKIWKAVVGGGLGLVLAFAIVGHAGAERCVQRPAGLVSWWPGEGNADDIQDSNPGVLNGGVTFAAGKVGQAFSFNGVNQFVQVPDASSLDPTAEATLDAWVKFNQLPSAAGHIMQIAAKAGVGRDLDLQAETDNKFHFFVAAGGSSAVVSTTVIVTGRWYHVAATYKATDRIQLYIDGVLEGTTLIPGVTRQANGDPFTIGASYVWHGRFFNGLIDEVDLFNRALDATEIQAIFDAGSAGKCENCVQRPAGLVSWWPGEGNADDIQDSNPGVLNGGVTFAAGKVGEAFSFNGVNQFVQVPHASSLDPTAEATLDAWVKFNQLPSAAGHIMQIAAKAGGGRDLDLQAETDNKFHFFVAGGAPSAVVSRTVIVTGRWYHVAATYKATDRIQLYIDGVLEGTTLIPGVTRQANGNPFTIGASYVWRGRFFNGLIDEVDLFSRALDATEIEAIFDAGSAGKCRRKAMPWIPLLLGD